MDQNVSDPSVWTEEGSKDRHTTSSTELHSVSAHGGSPEPNESTQNNRGLVSQAHTMVTSRPPSNNAADAIQGFAQKERICKSVSDNSNPSEPNLSLPPHVAVQNKPPNSQLAVKFASISNNTTPLIHPSQPKSTSHFRTLDHGMDHNEPVLLAAEKSDAAAPHAEYNSPYPPLVPVDISENTLKCLLHSFIVNVLPIDEPSPFKSVLFVENPTYKDATVDQPKLYEPHTVFSAQHKMTFNCNRALEGFCTVYTRKYPYDWSGTQRNEFGHVISHSKAVKGARKSISGIPGDSKWKYSVIVSVTIDERTLGYEFQIPTEIVELDGVSYDLSPEWLDVVNMLRSIANQWGKQWFMPPVYPVQPRVKHDALMSHDNKFPLPSQPGGGSPKPYPALPAQTTSLEPEQSAEVVKATGPAVQSGTSKPDDLRAKHSSNYDRLPEPQDAHKGQEHHVPVETTQPYPDWLRHQQLSQRLSFEDLLVRSNVPQENRPFVNPPSENRTRNQHIHIPTQALQPTPNTFDQYQDAKASMLYNSYSESGGGMNSRMGGDMEEIRRQVLPQGMAFAGANLDQSSPTGYPSSLSQSSAHYVQTPQPKRRGRPPGSTSATSKTPTSKKRAQDTDDHDDRDYGITPSKSRSRTTPRNSGTSSNNNRRKPRTNDDLGFQALQGEGFANAHQEDSTQEVAQLSSAAKRRRKTSRTPSQQAQMSGLPAESTLMGTMEGSLYSPRVNMVIPPADPNIFGQNIQSRLSQPLVKTEQTIDPELLLASGINPYNGSKLIDPNVRPIDPKVLQQKLKDWDPLKIDLNDVKPSHPIYAHNLNLLKIHLERQSKVKKIERNMESDRELANWLLRRRAADASYNPLKDPAVTEQYVGAPDPRVIRNGILRLEREGQGMGAQYAGPPPGFVYIPQQINRGKQQQAQNFNMLEPMGLFPRMIAVPGTPGFPPFNPNGRLQPAMPQGQGRRPPPMLGPLQNQGPNQFMQGQQAHQFPRTSGMMIPQQNPIGQHNLIGQHLQDRRLPYYAGMNQALVHPHAGQQVAEHGRWEREEAALFGPFLGRYSSLQKLCIWMEYDFTNYISRARDLGFRVKPENFESLRPLMESRLQSESNPEYRAFLQKWLSQLEIKSEEAEEKPAAKYEYPSPSMG